MDLVLKQNEKVFRTSLDQISHGLYKRLKELIIKLLKLQRKSPRASLEELCGHPSFKPKEKIVLKNSVGVLQVDKVWSFYRKF